MSIQGVFNSEVTKQSGVWSANIFVQFTAFLTCLLCFAFAGKEPLLSPLEAKPRFMLLGGVIGAVITFTVIQSMNMMGPARAVMIIVTTQLLVAYLIEVLGLFGVEQQPFQWRKLGGLILMMMGIVIFKWK